MSEGASGVDSSRAGQGARVPPFHLQKSRYFRFQTSLSFILPLSVSTDDVTAYSREKLPKRVEESGSLPTKMLNDYTVSCKSISGAAGRCTRPDRIRPPRLLHPRALIPNVCQESTCVARLTDGAARALTVAMRLPASTNRAAGASYRRATMPVGDADARVSAEKPSFPPCAPPLV